VIYLDNSATSGFKPESVIKAVSDTLRHISANPGRGGHSQSIKAGLLVHKTRQSLADYLGLKRGNVIFTGGCTQALNFAILGTVKYGGHVVSTVLEHNSVLRPLFELERMGQITLTLVAPDKIGNITPDAIFSAVKKDTYLVVTNHISNVTGAITPVAEIGNLCKKNGILYLEDGAQSVGYYDIDIERDNIDLLAIAPHKGLAAPQGIGALAIKEDIQIKPTLFGGTGTDSLNLFQPLELPESLESGTVATPAIAGLNAGLKWTKTHYKRNTEKLENLGIWAKNELSKISGITLYSTALYSTPSILAFNINGCHSSELAEILSDEYDICVRGGLHCAPLMHKFLGTESSGIVRASLGSDTTSSDIDCFLNAIKQIAKCKI